LKRLKDFEGNLGMIEEIFVIFDGAKKPMVVSFNISTASEELSLIEL